MLCTAAASSVGKAGLEWFVGTEVLHVKNIAQQDIFYLSSYMIIFTFSHSHEQHQLLLLLMLMLSSPLPLSAAWLVPTFGRFDTWGLPATAKCARGSSPTSEEFFLRNQCGLLECCEWGNVPICELNKFKGNFPEESVLGALC